MSENEFCEKDQRIQCEGRLSRIESKIDSFSEKIDVIFEKIEKQDCKIQSLEGWQKWLLGAGASIGSIGTIFLFLMDKIKIGG